VISLNELKNGNFNFGNIDTIIHTLFARPHRSSYEIQESLEFTQWLLVQVSKFHVPEFINISSFSVYGQNIQSYPNINCDTLYSQAKYSCELMVNSTQEINPHLKCVNLRLTTLIGQNIKEKPIDLISKWVVKTINHEPIQLIKNHKINRLDVNDAAIGIIKLMENIQKADRLTYDLASTNTYTLLEILELLKQVTINKNMHHPIIDTHIDFNDLEYPTIDLHDFYLLTNWLPSRSIVDSISELFDKFSK
jgi:nucleoside-diphosphate-sugar epimerase